MSGPKQPACGREGNGTPGLGTARGPQPGSRKGFFRRPSTWVFLVFNAVMLAWVISITTYLSDPALDADIVGADRFGLALIFSAWIVGDVLMGLFALVSRFLRRGR